MTASRTLVLLLTLAACGKRDATKPPPAPAPQAQLPVCGPAGHIDAVAGGAPSDPRRPTHTFSIVARDKTTGELGVAVQSHWFAVGSSVTWAEAGVGAVATQSFADPMYGRLGLGRMRAGVPAPDALASLLKDDPRPGVRQVAMVDAQGRVAAHTGDECIEVASQHIGDGYSVQANIMANDRVVPAIAEAFEHATGPLGDRLLAALDAGQAAGGDLRGCQSAALLVVKGVSSGEPSRDEVVDLRVDDAPAPLVELRRLLELQHVYDHMNAGDLAIEAKELDRAATEYATAAQAMPTDEIRYWQAVTLASIGKVDESLPIFREVMAHDPAYVELTHRLQKPGLVPSTPEGDAIITKILAQAP